MIPGINPKQMQKAMKQLGMKQEEINATEVIIKTPEKNLLISNPQVSKINMMGQETFQITGDISEESSISEEDIKMVIEQTSVSEEQAKEALEKNNGDLAKTIMELKE
ncbi:nascent polypeptide-associated complex protein [archaeon]|nr:nascent polypeptide-associated complex protein [archaeon]|tara:strand:- start:2730 stop:3053 length:324 start_codon:yes stop_codon:yes gene_type:complete